MTSAHITAPLSVWLSAPGGLHKHGQASISTRQVRLKRPGVPSPGLLAPVDLKHY